MKKFLKGKIHKLKRRIGIWNTKKEKDKSKTIPREDKHKERMIENN